MSDQTLEYTVTVHNEDGSYWAEVKELPGCFAAGDTPEELSEALAEAISFYLSTPEQEIKVRIADGPQVLEQVEKREFVLC